MSEPFSDQEILPPSRYLCLTILGYRKPGMSEEAYRRHMIKVSAPLTKELMIKYGIKRWTVIHNPLQTRDLMTKLFDRQMSNIADYDCFSQVVFESVEHYKQMKHDPWYKEHLFRDHEKFADVQRSKMTIGWIEEWINDGQVRNGMEFPSDATLVESEAAPLKKDAAPVRPEFVEMPADFVPISKKKKANSVVRTIAESSLVRSAVLLSICAGAWSWL